MRSIAVVFGGRSAEHDVSIITAHMPIIESLQASGQYDIWPVYISKEGRWYSDKAMNDLSYFRRDGYEESLARMKPVDISLNDGLSLVWPGIIGKRVSIDVVFPAMHGTYGEDGSLMGVLRMAHVAFVGCDLAASAVAMDKAFTKQVIDAEGLPVVPYVWFTKSQWSSDSEKILSDIQKLEYPIFVKPVHLGSSIGITKAKNEKELTQAIEVALHYDDKVLVEKSVENLIEVTLPIMGNDEPKTAHIERPLNKTEFFDFSDKYLSGGKKSGGVNSEYSEIPAQIDEDLARQVKDIGIRVYKTLGCSGIARVDFLIDGQNKKIYVNEVNTLPGSLYHHNWKKAGISNVELITSLIGYADERFNNQKDTKYVFNSDILKKVSGPKLQ